MTMADLLKICRDPAKWVQRHIFSLPHNDFPCVNTNTRLLAHNWPIHDCSIPSHPLIWDTIGHNGVIYSSIVSDDYKTNIIYSEETHDNRVMLFVDKCLRYPDELFGTLAKMG
ncbi:hypothetical protein HDU76_012302, partial [Blyttiomyces sp. JEL0837]